ncbi:N-acetylmuramic acid 6-phosphate etherase [Roseicyclus amphidinii]|jgi:N-acetylmuramic acid 6-phosphate etherase|uniref:N-acetylmuramic acid 6-phosphate etherase n=1 Tax=Roseicyclus amphidinii TaxID=3034232 RepID=UPI0024E0BFDF|nr:N-acetylmuramic acid 6-phosphate etherase [Roseicyclus sp. Amp-Y-6]
MAIAGTERMHDAAMGLDDRPLADVALVLAEAQVAAARVACIAAPAIAEASTALARTIRAGGTLHYIAAGSSGLMAAADAQELGGTFSIPASQLRIHMAGGLPTGVDMPGGTEDDTRGLEAELAGLSARDVIVAISASGTTPYTVAGAQIAKRAGAVVVGIANNPGSTLLQIADHPIELATPPEVVSGSTRMGAGTAQKIALNMLSTLMATGLGHVHDGMMVNLRADNIKLRGRAAHMVERIAGVDAATAAAALEATRGQVKPAVLVAKGQMPEAARILLRKTEGNLRAALARLT